MRIAKHGLGLVALSAGLCTPLAGQAPTGTGQALTLHGTCDGSAAVWLDDQHFVDANDEDPVLRVYSAKDGKALPAASLDLAAALGLDPGGEPDIEGGARVGDRIYWITSHGLDNDGVIRPERHRLFATSLTTVGGDPRLQPTGRSFYGLLKAIDKAAGDMPDLAALDLPAKAKAAPETPGGLNIEALAEGPNGSLLIGFRAPVAETGASSGKAWVLPLLNPAEVLDSTTMAKPKFDKPIPLDLGGRGLRDMTLTAKGYLLLAGSVGDAASPGFALYSWSGPGSIVTRKLKLPLGGMRPEALSATGSRLLILSDDGDEKPTGGKKCKNLDESERQFGGRVISMAEIQP